MIRTVRVYEVKPGKRAEVIALLKEIQAFSETQGVDERIFIEPWGDLDQVHVHFDHEDMAASQQDFERMEDNQRAQTALLQLDSLTERKPRVHALLER